jgi:vancomycin resistance protein YoaR
MVDRRKPTSSSAASSSSKARGTYRTSSYPSRPSAKTSNNPHARANYAAPRGAHGRSSAVNVSHGKGRGNSYAAPLQGSNGKGGRSHALPLVLAVLAILVLIVVGLSIADVVTSSGKIHNGVTVSGIDVSGLTVDEATEKIDSSLSADLAAQTVTVYATETGYEAMLSSGSSSASSTASSSTSSGDDTSVDESASTDAQTYSSWKVSAADVGATLDADAAAAAAYAVGRDDNVVVAWVERVASWFTSYDISCAVDLDDSLYTQEYDKFNESLGTDMVDYNIDYQDGSFVVVDGSAGSRVDSSLLRLQLEEALASDGDHVVCSMSVIPIANERSTAEQLAATADAAIAESFTLSYDDQTWEVTSDTMGSWVDAKTTYDDQGVAGLALNVDQTTAISDVDSLLGSEVYGSAVDASITIVSNKVVITDGSDGEGPDVKTAVAEMATAICNDSTDRSLTLAETVSEPEVTAAEIETWGITECIGSYYLNYDHGTTGTDRCYNIERALATLNDSVIAPGEYWNWNEVVGECDYTTGYKAATVIENGVETSGAGGGICNVATGIFNAAYEACLPIISRSNHSYYLSDYPLARDAAVSWTSPTLIFQNDTDNYILIHATWDGSYMTITIWGTSMGRTCTSTTTDWTYNSDGSKSITNYRNVYDSSGSLLWTDTFYSHYLADPSS